MKSGEIIADNPNKAGWSWRRVSAWIRKAERSEWWTRMPTEMALSCVPMKS